VDGVVGNCGCEARLGKQLQETVHEHLQLLKLCEYFLFCCQDA